MTGRNREQLGGVAGGLAGAFRSIGCTLLGVLVGPARASLKPEGFLVEAGSSAVFFAIGSAVAVVFALTYESGTSMAAWVAVGGVGGFMLGLGIGVVLNKLADN